MAKLYDCFTHIDDMPKEEAAYSRIEDPGPPPARSTAVIVKTPCALLEEGSKKIYGAQADYQVISESVNGSIPKFNITCRLSGSETSGEGKTKKLAKHIAAALMLKIMVNKNLRYASDMGIPSSNVQESLSYIDSSLKLATETLVDEDTSSEFDSKFNYVGKVQDLCLRYKLDIAIYESSEEGPSNDRTYITTCKVAQETTEGRAKQKKTSKSIAACKMASILEKGLMDMNKDFDVNCADTDVDPIAEQERAKVVEQLSDPIKTLEETLADETKFVKPSTEYKILEQLCTFGLPQCLLKVKFSRNAEVESTFVYPGTGSTNEEAKRDAAKAALVHLTL